MHLSTRQIEILRLLANQKKLGLATREEDRERQGLRRAGLIAYVGSPRRWQISSAGLAALAKATQP